MIFIIRIFGFIILFFLLRKAKKVTKINNEGVNKEDGLIGNEKFLLAGKIIRITLWIYGIKPMYYGLKNISKKSSLIISNHQSIFDGLIIAGAMYKVNKKFKLSYIAKMELKKYMWVKHYLKLVDTIFIDRNNVREAIKAFNEAKLLINKYGYSLLIFPEGTRSKKYQFNDFKPGAFKIAYSSSCEILPLFIVDSYKMKKFNFFTKKVKCIIDKPISTQKFLHLTTKDFSHIMEKKYQSYIEKYNNH